MGPPGGREGGGGDLIRNPGRMANAAEMEVITERARQHASATAGGRAVAMATAASGARCSALLRVRCGTSAFALGCWEPGGAGAVAPLHPAKRNKLGQLSNVEGPQMYLLMRGKGCSGAQFD